MDRLQREIRKSKPFDSLEQEAHLNLLRTTQILADGFERMFKPFNLSSTQYNVLRILRGIDQPMPCGQIGDRMVTRDPDVTRLLDRLEKRGLIKRERASSDRRVVLASITPAGLKLLKQLDKPVLSLHAGQLSHLGKDRLKSLIELLEAARDHQGE
jgi:DNA-binding MarR family transcriptional regulator